MKRNKSRKLCFVVFAGVMMALILPSSTLNAKETTEDIIGSGEQQEKAYNETIDSQLDEENACDNAAEENVSAENEEFKENSWRYSDGELIVPNTFSSRAATNAWKKINGQYYNDRGEVIPGVKRRGVDVSEHQGQINWEKAKADGVEYAIIRIGWTGNQSRHEDTWFKYNVSECERLGIPYGVYLYSYITTTDGASGAADFVLGLLAGHSLSYPVYLDLEDDDIVNADNATISQIFLNKISSAGYKVGIYANLNWWNNYLTSSVFNNSSWSKWVAQYYHSCSYTGTYDMWQCTSQGSVDGISGYVDLNMDFRIGIVGPELVVKEDGTYCYLDGRQLYGEQKVNGKWYYFDESDHGRMQTGWHNFKSKTVYYGSDGAMVYGDQKIDGKWYMFARPTGAMVTGWYDNTEKGKRVYYGSDGVMVYGEQKIDSKWYMFASPTGAMVTGWYDNTEKGKRVYYGSDGAMLYGEQKIDGKWYMLASPTGAMVTGWYDNTEKGKRVYYSTDGGMVYGEQKIDGKWYMLASPTGAMVTGWYDNTDKEKRVYYGLDGAMLYGEQEIDGKTYIFAEQTGAMVIGWYQSAGGRKYCDVEGTIVTGEKKIDGKWYHFDENTGFMTVGMYKLPSKTVYYGEDGAMVYGEKKVGGKWYCFKSVTGEMVRGWYNLPTKTVYYGEDGAMVYGKQVINGVTYYFMENTGALVRE